MNGSKIRKIFSKGKFTAKAICSNITMYLFLTFLGQHFFISNLDLIMFCNMVCRQQMINVSELRELIYSLKSVKY